MSHHLNLDAYSRQILTEDQAVSMLYTNPELDVGQLTLDVNNKFNAASKLLHIDLFVSTLGALDINPIEYHKLNQDKWRMPDEYANLDIAGYLLELTTTQAELQRVGEELLLYHDRNMFNLLRFLVYMVDTMRENDIVWGVGRGSSVASYVLYLIGIHKIDSLYYDLDIMEFLR